MSTSQLCFCYRKTPGSQARHRWPGGTPWTPLAALGQKGARYARNETSITEKPIDVSLVKGASRSAKGRFTSEKRFSGVLSKFIFPTMDRQRTARRPGRPPLPASRRRCVSVLVRVTPSEHEVLIASARAAGVSVASFLRDTGLRLPMRAAPAAIDLRAVQEMNRLGNNLNQLLVLAHTHRVPTELSGTIEALLVLLDAIHQKVISLGEGGQA